MGGEELVELPVVDLSSPDVAAVIRKVHEEAGIFYVVNHGIPSELLEQVLQLLEEFFSKTPEYKSGFAVDEGKFRADGYSNGANFGPNVLREMFYMNLMPPRNRNMSKCPPYLREKIEELGSSSVQVYEKLMMAISQALCLDPYYIRNALCPGDLKLTFAGFMYPRNKVNKQVVAVPEHTDVGTVVLLFADEIPAFQVVRNGRWYTVKPQPGAFIVFFGEILEVMSNGAYCAAPHRVLLNKAKSRCSAGFIFEPSETAEIAPARSLLLRSNAPPRYRKFMYGERFKEIQQGKYLKKFVMLQDPSASR